MWRAPATRIGIHDVDIQRMDVHKRSGANKDDVHDHDKHRHWLETRLKTNWLFVCIGVWSVPVNTRYRFAGLEQDTVVGVNSGVLRVTRIHTHRNATRAVSALWHTVSLSFLFSSLVLHGTHLSQIHKCIRVGSRPLE